MKSNGMFCKKIIDRYRLNDKYYFHGISLVFLKNQGRIFPDFNGKAPLTLLLQTFFTYWKYNRNGGKHIGNQAVYIRNMKQFMDIRMLLTPDYYLSAYEIEKRLLERLQKGQDITRTQMEESEIFRAWDMGKALKEPFAAHKSRLPLSWENRRKYFAVRRLLSLDRNRKNSRQAHRWIEEELKRALFHKSKVFNRKVNKEDGRELARVTLQMKEELKERLLKILKNGFTETFEKNITIKIREKIDSYREDFGWDAKEAEKISRSIVENAIENEPGMYFLIEDQQTKAAQEKKRDLENRLEQKIDHELYGALLDRSQVDSIKISQSVLALKEALSSMILRAAQGQTKEKLKEDISLVVSKTIHSYKKELQCDVGEINQLRERITRNVYDILLSARQMALERSKVNGQENQQISVREQLTREISIELDRVLLYQGHENKEDITQAMFRLKEELRAVIQAIPKEAAAEKLQEYIKNEVKRIINSYKNMFDFSTDEISQLNEIAARYMKRRFNPISDRKTRTEFYFEQDQKQTVYDSVRESMESKMDIGLDQEIIQELNWVLQHRRQESRIEEKQNTGEETARAVLRLREELKTAIEGWHKEEAIEKYQENLAYEARRILNTYKENLDLNEKEIIQFSERISRKEIQRLSQIENENKKEAISAGQGIDETGFKESWNIRRQKQIPGSNAGEGQKSGLELDQEISRELDRVLLHRRQESRIEERQNTGEETAKAVLRLKEELKTAIEGWHREEETEKKQENLANEVKRILNAYKEILDFNEKEITRLSGKVSSNEIRRLSQRENDNEKETMPAGQGIKESGVKESWNIRKQKQIPGSNAGEGQENRQELELDQEISHELDRVLLHRRQEKRIEESQNTGEETARAVLRLKEELKTAIEGWHKGEETEKKQENLANEVKRILNAYKEILDFNEKEITRLSGQVSSNEIRRLSQRENDNEKETMPAGQGIKESGVKESWNIRKQKQIPGSNVGEGQENRQELEFDQEISRELDRVLQHRRQEKRIEESQNTGEETARAVLRLKEELKTAIEGWHKEEAIEKYQENLAYEARRILNSYKENLDLNEKEIIQFSERISRKEIQRLSQIENENEKGTMPAGQGIKESEVKESWNIRGQKQIPGSDAREGGKNGLELKLDQEISHELDRVLLHRRQEKRIEESQNTGEETARAVLRLKEELKAAIEGWHREEETEKKQENLANEVKRILNAYKEILDFNEKEITRLSGQVSSNEIRRLSQRENDNEKETMPAGQGIKESEVKESWNIRGQKQIPGSDARENEENGLEFDQEISRELDRVLLHRRQEKRTEESQKTGEETARAVLRLKEELKAAIEGWHREEETEKKQENLANEVKRILNAYKEILDFNEKEITRLSGQVSSNEIRRLSQRENNNEKETMPAGQGIKESGVKESWNIRSEKQIPGSDARENEENGLEFDQEISREFDRVLLHRRQEKQDEESQNTGEETARAVLRLREELKTAIEEWHKEEAIEKYQENLAYEARRILNSYKENLDLNEKEIIQFSERISRKEIQRLSQIENDNEKETMPAGQGIKESEVKESWNIRGQKQIPGSDAREGRKNGLELKLDQEISHELDRVLLHRRQENQKEKSQTEDQLKWKLQTIIHAFPGEEKTEKYQEIRIELNQTLLHQSQAAKRKTPRAALRLIGELKTVIQENRKKGKIAQSNASTPGSINQIFRQEQKDYTRVYPKIHFLQLPSARCGTQNKRGPQRTKSNFQTRSNLQKSQQTTAEKEDIKWNHSLAYEPVVQMYRKRLGEIKPEEREKGPLEETKILKKQIYASKEMAQQQDKKILSLEKQLESQKAKMEETIYQAEKTMELNTSNVKKITAQVIDEMQRQLRLEKMRRGMD